MEKEQFEVIKDGLTKILNNTDRAVVETKEEYHESLLEEILSRIKRLEEHLGGLPPLG